MKQYQQIVNTSGSTIYDKKKEYILAQHHYERAANQGHREAQSNLAALHKKSKEVPTNRKLNNCWYEKTKE